MATRSPIHTALSLAATFGRGIKTSQPVQEMSPVIDILAFTCAEETHRGKLRRKLGDIASPASHRTHSGAQIIHGATAPRCPPSHRPPLRCVQYRERRRGLGQHRHPDRESGIRREDATTHLAVRAQCGRSTSPHDCRGRERPVDDVLCDVAQETLSVSCIPPQPGERLRYVNAGPFGQDALGLLDGNPAFKRGL